MSVTPEHVKQVLAEADCLVPREQVEAAMDRMAEAITRDLADGNPLILCVMTGGVVAAGHLLTRLHFPLQVDYLHATRYRGALTGGEELHWLVKPQTSLKDRTVLVLDDILDEGHTLAGILDYCRQEGAREVLSAALVLKHHDRRVPGLEADYLGVEVEDRYVFGYGMDYKEYLRNAPGIYAVKGC
ncbi:hypoxanthine-guanine phosphoribosyltransferase [Ectothiorhodospira lacustris]|uniref:hypoxanthine-guanine phosphoribosyltransferase n=1 Tax=Ectothiorhodospira lacustris TaxID=2899127 RepID=UPI001EE7FB92|nr:hypoxanthine-guanine phosphoribosyltransferase [Ectothiorhodospira lacustris]MCG5509340.1 hypoxanthine-guanine phosphoribosyltransferase [Ectothiorhodospira lacustris]MCG5521394.1 hypoxanthine-guanine phosphoribosyltransferase [Ectothiorhodospira lacustris]